MKKGIYILIISMLVLAGGLILPVSRIMAETDNAEVDNDSCGDQEELVEETKITIYTYLDEVYQVSGSLNTVQKGTDSQTAIIEMQGNIEEIESTETNSFPDELQRGTPTVLTVYTGAEVYGFYSNYELISSDDSQGDSILYYGHMVGYFDGDKAYSS